MCGIEPLRDGQAHRIGTREFDPASREYTLLSSLVLRRALPRPAVLGGPARPGLPPWEAEDLGDYDLLNPSSAARRKQVLLEEGWPRGELPSKVGCASTCRLALRCGIRWAWPTMAMPLRPVGEYLYDAPELRADAGHRTSGPHAEQKNFTTKGSRTRTIHTTD